MPCQRFERICAVGGIVVIVIYLVACPPAGFLPPKPPSWDAEHVVQHYRDHRQGYFAAAPLFVFAGMFYISYTATISAQMRRFPIMSDVVWIMQLSLGIVGGLIIMMFGLALAVTNYRLDRPAEITQALNDLAFIVLLLTWPTFLFQSWTFAYGLFIGAQRRVLFAKSLAVLNAILPVFYIPATAVHCVTTGPFAWNGALSYWFSVVPRVILLFVNSLFLLRLLSNETAVEDENLDNSATSPIADGSSTKCQ